MDALVSLALLVQNAKVYVIQAGMVRNVCKDVIALKTIRKVVIQQMDRVHVCPVTKELSVEK